MTAADDAGFDGLDVAAIVDLRSAIEREARPNRLPSGYGGTTHSVPGYITARAPHYSAGEGARCAADVHRAFRKAYARMPFDEKIVIGLRLYFRVIGDIDGTTLVHCAAGKDRTGIAVAMLHAAVGVHRDDIFADYLKSAEWSEAQFDRLIAATSDQEANGQDPLWRVAASVEAEYLEAMFASIEKQGTGLDRYLKNVLALGAVEREALLIHISD